jgi:hypothetical protein
MKSPFLMNLQVCGANNTSNGFRYILVFLRPEVGKIFSGLPAVIIFCILAQHHCGLWQDVLRRPC